VTGGENVYPAEVENALFGHPARADAAVVGVPDDTWRGGEGDRCLEARRAAADIIAWARARIANFKTPKSVDFVDLIPLPGKILRRELRETYWTGRDRRVN
jgi:acyl-CoA synthetase (AMP-forming)/AMP-acid ligase II